LKKRTPRVTEAEFQEHKLAVAALTGWVFSHVPISTAAGEVLGTEISRSFSFKNFNRAFTFMARVSELAESRSHHPDWRNVWNRVDVPADAPRGRFRACLSAEVRRPVRGTAFLLVGSQ